MANSNDHPDKMQIRRVLAVIGLILILASFFLSVSLRQQPEINQLQDQPPASLFQPPSWGE
jgi:hypothetical protein